MPDDNVLIREFLKSHINVVFVEPETPGNIGFLARTMANFGLKKLILINPCELKEESYYQAMHAQEIVHQHQEYKTLDEFQQEENIDFMVATTGTPGGSYNLSRIAIRVDELGSALINNNQLINANIAIIFGREGNGLYNDELRKCDMSVSIPTDEEYPIMNISHAAAIVFYEIFHNLNEFKVEGVTEASTSEKEYLLDDLEEIISKLDIPPHKSRNGLKAFKNIINRAFITGREAHTLKGIFRRINKKIE